MTQAIALIGYGAIGKAVHRLLLERGTEQAEVTAILTHDRSRILEQSPEIEPLLVDNLQELIARCPSLVVECAGHQAVDAHAITTLAAGLDLLLVSVGSMADKTREQKLVETARSTGKRLILPSGAIGGVDWLVAARSAGLANVTYRSRKPPQAWVGSAAEQLLDLSTLTEATVIFRGSAREAALMYPRNANVAATVALATLGFDRTQVELIADPDASGNVHEIEANGEGGSMATRLIGRPDPDNPRTSMMTAHSVVHCILNQTATVVM